MMTEDIFRGRSQWKPDFFCEHLFSKNLPLNLSLRIRIVGVLFVKSEAMTKNMKMKSSRKVKSLRDEKKEKKVLKCKWEAFAVYLQKREHENEDKWRDYVENFAQKQFHAIFHCDPSENSSNETARSNHAGVKQKGRQKSELWKTESIISSISFVESLSLLLSSPFTLWLP